VRFAIGRYALYLEEKDLFWGAQNCAWMCELFAARSFASIVFSSSGDWHCDLECAALMGCSVM